MATIRPFAALRPKPELAARICELPYDVMSSEEARQVAAANPLSFFHVSKPEIDFPTGTDLYSEEVYAKGKANLDSLISQGALRQDGQANLYLYRQVMADHTQVGLVAVASCAEYLKGIVKKHEFTRPEKEDDRVRHIETLNSQTGPVFLTYRAVPRIEEIVADEITRSPDVDFTAKDNVRHTAWILSERRTIDALCTGFAGVPSLYIADGHHRCAAAGRVFQTRKGHGQSASFLSVIFPHNQMQILPYHRVLKDLNGLSSAALLEKLDGIFIIQENGRAQSSRRHEMGFYLEGKWRTLTFRPRFAATTDPIEKLDVTLLQNYVLGPIFSIEDPRTSSRIGFVGGIRGTGELESQVNKGDYACAFSMFPTRIEQLMEIADAGGVMPPKSTWFEPKLRDAMFCHLLE